MSFQLTCETQADIDHYWDRLSAGGQEGPCGWLKDRYGLSWQVVPTGMDELFAEPEFRGCAFAMATAEAHSPVVDQAADGYRAWVRSLLTGLAREAGAPDPELLGLQLHLLYDGASQSARMDRAPAAASGAARAAATVLLDAVLPDAVVPD